METKQLSGFAVGEKGVVKTISGSSAAPVDENPKTGVGLGAAALAAMAAAAGIWVCKKRE